MTPAPITKYVSSLNLNRILSGTQKKTVKMNCDFWRDEVHPNETRILFTDGERHVEVQIVKKSFFQTFGDAWFTHGDEIFPEGLNNNEVTTIDQANKVFLRRGYKESEIQTFGVVVVEFSLLP